MDAERAVRPPAGAITIERDGADGVVLCLRGDVDTEVATRFSRAHQRVPVEVDAMDARDVTFISSSGLAVLLRSVEASRAAGRRPVLRAASHQVTRALQLAGIDGLFARSEAAAEPPPSAD